MTQPQTVEQRITVAGRELVVTRPSDYDSLLTEEAFENESLLPYWAHLWDSGLLLADVAAAEVKAGMRVLELGCGLGVPSIASALAGAEVTATDWSPEALAATSANAERSGAEVRTLLVDWTAPEALIDAAPWDMVLAADIVYEAKQVPLLLDLLPRLTATVLLAEPGRAIAEPFFEQVTEAWDLERLAVRESPRVAVDRLTARRLPGPRDG